MVMDRLGTDLQMLFMENGQQLKKQTVLQLGCLMVSHNQYMVTWCLVARNRKVWCTWLVWFAKLH